MVLSAYEKSTLFPMTGGPFLGILKGVDTGTGGQSEGGTRCSHLDPVAGGRYHPLWAGDSREMVGEIEPILVTTQVPGTFVAYKP